MVVVVTVALVAVRTIAFFDLSTSVAVDNYDAVIARANWTIGLLAQMGCFFVVEPIFDPPSGYLGGLKSGIRKRAA